MACWLLHIHTLSSPALPSALTLLPGIGFWKHESKQSVSAVPPYCPAAPAGSARSICSGWECCAESLESLGGKLAQNTRVVKQGQIFRGQGLFSIWKTGPGTTETSQNLTDLGPSTDCTSDYENCPWSWMGLDHWIMRSEKYSNPLYDGKCVFSFWPKQVQKV